MTELLKTLCALPGPSGCEDAVRAFVLKRAKPHADALRTDAIGNVMVFRKGRKALDRPVVVCAHMDEVGVIVKKITDDGMIKFGFVGGVDPRVVIGRPVRFGEVTGVIGASDDRCRAPDHAQDQGSVYRHWCVQPRGGRGAGVAGGLWCVRLPCGCVWRWAD